jgi:formate dehydrogenase subunit delta
MTHEEITRLANEIGKFFAAYPHDEALKGVQGHIHDFWDPRMRKALKAYVAEGGKGLSPLVLEAAAQL